MSVTAPPLFPKARIKACAQVLVIPFASLPPPHPLRFVEAHPEAGITACAFLGDDCSTLRMTDDIRELNERYYEPLAKVGGEAIHYPLA